MFNHRGVRDVQLLGIVEGIRLESKFQSEICNIGVIEGRQQSSHQQVRAADRIERRDVK
jgi:hypothetical protein